MPVNTLQKSAFGLSLVAIASSTFAQLNFEDLPPSAQMRWMKPLPVATPPLRPVARMILAPQAPIEGGIPNPHFTECVFYDDFGFFTPQPDAIGDPPMLVPLQDGMLGVTWETSRDFIGMTNDALYAALGGTPPTGLTPNGESVERYIAFARETLGEGPITSFSLGMNARAFGLLLPGVGSPNQVSQQVYIQTDDGVPDTALWWSPTSFVEGFVTDRMFFGGVYVDTVLSAFANENNVLDRFASLGPLNGVSSGQFYANPYHSQFPFPTDQWFTILQNISQAPGGSIGQSAWVKTVDTANANPPFLDPRMATGDIIAPDGDPTGWICTYPGFEDDPKTADVIEGIGRATTQFGEFAPMGGAFSQATLLAAISMDGVQFGVGSDPVSLKVPDYSPNDYFFGPICFGGAPYEQPCIVPAFVLPYVEDLENYRGGEPIHIQTSRWFDEVHSNAIITFTHNTTPGGSQSIAQQNTNNDNLLRPKFGTALPPGAIAASGEPLVASVQIRLNPTTRTSRVVVLGDDENTGDFSAFVVLSGRDPTSEFALSDGMVYVRQPNPDFNAAAPADDHYVQMHWLNPDDWLTPPAQPLNLKHVLVPTGATARAGQFAELRLEIEPKSLDPDEPPTMRVFFNGQELFPNGDPKQSWAATSRTANSLEFWSGADNFGQFDTFHVDDIMFDGFEIPISAGPPFTSPYAEGFSTFAHGASIHGQGVTPFLNPESVPTGAATQNEPQVTVVPTATMPESGDLVCRYELVESCLDEQSLLPPEGSVLAIPTAPLPPLPNGAAFACPGGAPTPFFDVRPFEIRDANSGQRIGVGRWTLINSEPAPFDSGAGNVTGFEFHYEHEPVWRVATPRNQGLIAPDVTEGVNQTLRIENPGGVTDFNEQSDLFESIDALFPEAIAMPEDFPNAPSVIELAFDLYIESVEVDGNPVIAPPRSRLALTLDGVTPTLSDRITEFVFGGPNMPGGVPAENIAYLDANGDFIDTGFSLVAPSAPFSGPLLNTWVRVIVEVNNVGQWRLLIDEDRDGPAPAHEVTTGEAIDAANLVVDDMVRIYAFRLRQGRDYGGSGEPMTPPRSVRIRPGGAMSVGPPDADPNDDYCFYEISHQAAISATDPPMIAQVVGDLTGEVFGFRELAEGDVIAVLNRRTNPDNTVAGNPRIHERCPTLPFDEIELFGLTSEDGSEIAFEGRWISMGLVGLPGEDLPSPAGGLSRPDGPVQEPPVSYNDPTQEPPGYPQQVIARPILLADWAMDADDGAAPSEPPLPRSRWYVDNLSIRDVANGAPCADIASDPDVVDGADLAFLLAAWGAMPESAADFNGDGFVNGADLATLLANWGPCPE